MTGKVERFMNEVEEIVVRQKKSVWKFWNWFLYNSGGEFQQLMEGEVHFEQSSYNWEVIATYIGIMRWR